MRNLLNLLLAFILFVSFSGYAQKPSERHKLFKDWENYEVSTIQVGTEGTKFIKVWGYGKKIDRAITQAKKNAIHACLFRGIPGNGTAMSTPAIIRNSNVLDENIDYFYEFFETAGAYLQFVNVTTDGMPSGQDRREVKGGYKVAIKVQVMYDNLKTKMETEGFATKLNSGF